MEDSVNKRKSQKQNNSSSNNQNNTKQASKTTYNTKKKTSIPSESKTFEYKVNLLSSDTKLTLTRNIFLKLLSLIYLIAFSSLYYQIPALFGSNGVLPATSLKESLLNFNNKSFSFFSYPSITLFSPIKTITDNYLLVNCLIAIVISLLSLINSKLFSNKVSYCIMYIIYLDFYLIGQDFMDTSFDTLLLEVGLLAIIISPGISIPFIYNYIRSFSSNKNNKNNNTSSCSTYSISDSLLISPYQISVFYLLKILHSKILLINAFFIVTNYDLLSTSYFQNIYFPNKFTIMFNTLGLNFSRQLFVYLYLILAYLAISIIMCFISKAFNLLSGFNILRRIEVSIGIISILLHYFFLIFISSSENKLYQLLMICISLCYLDDDFIRNFIFSISKILFYIIDTDFISQYHSYSTSEELRDSLLSILEIELFEDIDEKEDRNDIVEELGLMRFGKPNYYNKIFNIIANIYILDLNHLVEELSEDNYFNNDVSNNDSSINNSKTTSSINELNQAGEIMSDIQKEESIDKRKEKYENYLKDRTNRYEQEEILEQGRLLIYSTISKPIKYKTNFTQEIIWLANLIMLFFFIIIFYGFVFINVNSRYFKPSLSSDFSIITSCLFIDVFYYSFMFLFYFITISLIFNKQSITSILNRLIIQKKDKEGKGGKGTNYFSFNSISQILSSFISQICFVLYFIFTFFYLLRTKNTLNCYLESTVPNYCYNFKSIFGISNNDSNAEGSNSNKFKIYLKEFDNQVNKVFDSLKLNNNDMFFMDKTIIGDIVSENNCYKKKYLNKYEFDEKSVGSSLASSKVLSSGVKGKPVIEIYYTDRISDDNDINSNLNREDNKNQNSDDQGFKPTWFELELPFRSNFDDSYNNFSLHIPRLELVLSSMGHYQKTIQSLSKNKSKNINSLIRRNANRKLLILISFIDKILKQDTTILNYIDHNSFLEDYGNIEEHRDQKSFIQEISRVIMHFNSNNFGFKVKPYYIKVKAYTYQFTDYSLNSMNELINKIYMKKQYNSVFLNTVNEKSLERVLERFGINKRKINDTKDTSSSFSEFLASISLITLYLTFMLIKLLTVFVSRKK